MRNGLLNAFLVRKAEFAGKYEFPVISSCNETPVDIMPFSRARKSFDYHKFICFYERDKEFENVWTHPRDYIKMFRRFCGIIGLDYSLYRDMPLGDQITSTMKGRKLCYFYQHNGVKVIPNIRFGDERTYEFCFDGIPENSVIAVGTHGNTKDRENLKYMIKGFEAAIQRLHPSRIIIYGSAPLEITSLLEYHKTACAVYKSETGKVFFNRKIRKTRGPPLPWDEQAIREGA
jgi:glycosyltransferase involved in cell wall biosynthesis